MLGVRLRLPRLLEPPLELLLPPDLPHEEGALLTLPPALADLQDADGLVEGEGLGVGLRLLLAPLQVPIGGERRDELLPQREVLEPFVDKVAGNGELECLGDELQVNQYVVEVYEVHSRQLDQDLFDLQHTTYHSLQYCLYIHPFLRMDVLVIAVFKIFENLNIFYVKVRKMLERLLLPFI